MANLAIDIDHVEDLVPLKRMCRRGFPLHTRYWSLIHEAVIKVSPWALSYLLGRSETCDYIASAHIDVVLESPIFLIVSSGQTDLLKILMRAGISLAPIRRTSKDSFLMHAIRLSLGDHQSLLIVRIILRALREQANGLMDPKWINLVNAAGHSAFSLASGRRDLLALLVAAGANPPITAPPDYPFPSTTAMTVAVIPDISMETIL